MMLRLTEQWLAQFLDPVRAGSSGVLALVVTIGAQADRLPQPLNKLFPALVIVMALDFITGVAVAIHRHEFCWSGLLKGVVKTFMYGGVILTTVAVDWVVPSVFPSLTGPLFVIWGVAFLAIVDALSTLEHLAALGAPMPRGLRKALQKMKRGLDRCPDPGESGLPRWLGSDGDGNG